MAEYDFLNTNSYRLFRDKYLSENNNAYVNPPEEEMNALTKSLMERMISNPGVLDKILSNNGFDPNKFLGSSNAPQSSFGSNFSSNNGFDAKSFLRGDNPYISSFDSIYNSNDYFSNSFGSSYNPFDAGGNGLTPFGAGSDKPTAWGNLSSKLSQESAERLAKLYDTSNVKTSNFSKNVGTYSQIANVAGDIMQSIGKSKEAKNTPEGYFDKTENTANSINQVVDVAKDTVAAFLGPYGQLFRGIEKLGKGIGDAIGGGAGGVVSGLFSPTEGTIYGLANKDFNFGEKLLSTIPGVGGLLMARDKQKKRMKYESDKYFKNIEYLETERERKQRLDMQTREIEKRKILNNLQLGLIQNEYNYG